ncbi:MAG: DUF1800 domain-containing protein [Saprospiraceae bacterium]|nr:DUF1800 domain-containing protein [Saprospiraceae bacterium]MDW8230344.1 DUF1800 domain-containing protein [Saprospiraceae bacterium]
MSYLHRRDFLALLSGQRSRSIASEAPLEPALSPALENLFAQRSANPPTSGLAPYTGPWTRAEVIHLLRRTLFGPTKADVDYFLSKGMNQAVYEILRAPYSPPAGPVNDYNNPNFTDPQVPFGQSFVNAPLNPLAEPYRIESVRGWWLRLLLNSGRSIREKMTLFWHNHIPVEFSIVPLGSALYRYNQTLRDHALGNFRSLIRAITLDPAMLFYLNGYLNSRQAPDENYAREIQELFVIGKDLPQHYTEDDVKAAARLLTGWRTDGFTTTFSPFHHDVGDKQFSAFYNNRLIKGRSGPNAGAIELDEFLDMLLAHPEAARFICRKIYRFFVYHDISPEVEQNVIEPLAQIFRSSNYDILPVLETLFRSEHFFDPLNRGAIIKSPADMTVGLFRCFGVQIPATADLFDRLVLSYQINLAMAAMMQHLGDPPNVSGWQAYYQRPLFDKIWITTATLPKRAEATDAMVFTGIFGINNRIAIDPLTWAATLTNPSNVNALINESLELLLGLPVSQEVKNSFKAILLSNLPDESYWTYGWMLWQNNPNDPTLSGALRIRLQAYLQRVLQMEEFHLC